MNRFPRRPTCAARRQPHASSNIVLFGLLGLMMVGMMGGGYGLYVSGMLAPPPRLDKETACLQDTPTTHSALILIDETNALNQAEIEKVKDRVRKTAAATPDFGLVTVAVLNPDDATSPRIVFRRCAPRSPEDASAITAGEEVLRAEWNKKFEGPLLEAVTEAAASQSEAERSPIIATITALAQRPDFDASIKERELIVVSDLLEFNPKGGYSQTQGGDLVGMFRRSTLAGIWPDLKGTAVSIEYVQRQEPLLARAQTPAHRAFWTWWLKTAGASSVEFIGVREPPPLPPLPSIPRKKQSRSKAAWRRNCEC